MMKQLYFERDKKRGIPKTFCWLVEEIGELAKSVNKENIDISQEFADVLASLVLLAIELDIDISTVMKRKIAFTKERFGLKK